MLRREVVARRAGSRVAPPGWARAMRRRPRLVPARERLDDDHAAAAAGTRRTRVKRLLRLVVVGRRRDGQEMAGEREAGLAGGAGEQAVVADVVEALGQDVEQEAADELVGGERHDLLPLGLAAAIVLVAEGDVLREEFRAPAGVRKSPRNEPAGCRWCAMELSASGRSGERSDGLREGRGLVRASRIVADSA